MNENAYCSVRWKTEKTSLAYHTNPRTKSGEQSRNGKRSHYPRKSVRSVYVCGGKDLPKRQVFEFRVKEWRGDVWRKWRREGWVEISMKRWNWFTKWSRKLVPEVRRDILKRAIGDISVLWEIEKVYSPQYNKHVALDTDSSKQSGGLPERH